ncbi:MAG: addiction module protein [Cyanobacteria bacterium J06641_5]
MNTDELIAEVLSLPVEQRVLVIDSALKSMNQTDNEIDRQWLEVAKSRLEELRAGTVKAVPGREVFEKIGNRLA